MKPRLFIGSSTEALDIAYVIQENLAYDSNPTVWTQGIFELSNNTLDDLLKALSNFDFGIFVFKPDDISVIRNNKLSTVRDNVIFELGLFIGKLGKQRVFFVLPDSTDNFHLPTDLLGLTPGRYNSEREDNNLKAALGPFCNQVRSKLKTFVYESLIDLENETELAKSIAIEKKDYWEFFLTAELLESRLLEINRSYQDLEKGLIYTKTRSQDSVEFPTWAGDAMEDMIRLIDIFKKIFETELLKAFGEPGVAGNVYEIKIVADKIHSVCKELLAWEFSLQSVKASEDFEGVTELMKGWSKIVIDEINKFPTMLRNAFDPNLSDLSKPINLNLTFSKPPNTEKIMQILKTVRSKFK